MVARRFSTVAVAAVALMVRQAASQESGSGAGKPTADDYIKRGGDLLKTGDFSAALDQYHAACDTDPKSYMSFYRRATVYLATSRAHAAAKDLARVIEIKPDFVQARTRLAELRIKDGSYKLAREDYNFMNSDPKSAASLVQLDTVEALILNAGKLKEQGDFNAAVDLYTQAIDISPSYVKLRLNRAACYEANGEYGQAIGDVARASKLRSGNSDSFFLLSRLHFKTGDRAESLKQIRECVKLDGDNKPAMTFYRRLKKFNKAMDKLEAAFQRNQFKEILEYIDTARELDADKTFTYQDELNLKTCRTYRKMGDQDKAMEACTATLELNPRSVDALIERSDLWGDKTEFEKMIEDLKQAKELEGEQVSQRVKEKLQRAEKLLKQSKKRDYYKILGVPRNARNKEIVKAYRTLAKEWHPDNHKGEEEKAIAEAKFMDIASAKEVLTDEKMRRLFDDGEDPLDAEQERERNQGGGFPGGFPFGGGGGQRFHFRH